MTTAVERWERALSPEFVLFPAARDALLRFGGIRVEQEGPGRQWARPYASMTGGTVSTDRSKRSQPRTRVTSVDVEESRDRHAWTSPCWLNIDHSRFGREESHQ
jgi:hypothetical protein